MSTQAWQVKNVLRRFRRWGLAALLAAGLLAAAWQPGAAGQAPQPAAGHPAQAGGLTLSARGGFDGYYREGRWLPVRVLVGNDGPDLEATLEVVVPRSGGSRLAVQRPVSLPNQSRREIFLYVPAEGYLTSLKVRLVRDGAALVETNVRVVDTSQSDLIYGVLAGTPSAFNLLANLDPVSGSAFVAQLELADLPPVSAAWAALDVLVLSDVDTGALSVDQRSALTGWVATGGRLLVAGGPGWQKTGAGLAELLPLAPAGTATLADLQQLVAFAAANSTPFGSAVAATGSLAPDAIVLARAGDVPLLATRRVGFGQVTYSALDPAIDPLRNWPGLEGLLRNALAGGADLPGWAGGPRNWYSARDAANALPGLGFPSTLAVCGFLAVYLVAVGPANYLVLRRAKRRELAWVTIPAIVLLFSAGAYVTGAQLRGGRAVLHRLAIVQTWPGAEQARVDGIVGLFSPRRTDYDLAFGGGYLARPLPGDGFGGASTDFRLVQADDTRVPNVRMDVGAVEPFYLQGLAAAPSFGSTLRLEASQGNVTVAGTVTNASDLVLDEAVLLVPGGATRLGRLDPGQTVHVSQVLFNTRAQPASAKTVAPVFGGRPGIASQPVYPGGYDTTIDDILGGGSYWDDRAMYRKYSLLTSLIESYGGTGRGGGVYLVGWASTSPLPVQVTDAAFETHDLTLYIVGLTADLNLGTGVLTVPPGLMTWTALNLGQSTATSAYDMYMYQGNEATLRFTPSLPITFSAVQALELHVVAPGYSGPSPLDVDLWDVGTGEWVPVSSLQWGDNSIAEPDRFVGPGGEIQVRVRNQTPTVWNVERVDFTLRVER